MNDITVADLLQLAALSGATLLGGTRGTDEVVTGVGVWALGSPQTQTASAGDVVVVESHAAAQSRGLALDVALHRAHAQGVVLVVLPTQEHTTPLATARLADRLRLPTVLADPEIAPARLVADLHRVLDDDATVQACALLDLASALASADSADEVVAAISTHHPGAVSIATETDGVVSGSLDGPRPADLARVRRPQVVGIGARTCLVQPVTVAGAAPSAWLVLAHPAATQRWLAQSRRVAAVAETSVARVLAGELLEAERLARERARVLTEVVRSPDDVGHPTLEAARAAGLTLTGWHVAMFVLVQGEGAVRVGTGRLEAALRAAGAESGPLVERPEGWATWLSSPQPPTPARLRRETGAVSQALRAVTDEVSGVRACLGVGSAVRDVPGVVRSLAQARHAALVGASSSAADVSVRVVQDLGSSRLLLGWYGSGAFRELADEILEPLLLTGDAETVHTLAAYLDRACSASQTARHLGVHRNTVKQRLQRAEHALSVSLGDPDTRLALQLALRARLGDATTG